MDQQKKIDEMIKNINGLKADVSAMKEAIKDINKGQKEIEKLLRVIE